MTNTTHSARLETDMMNSQSPKMGAYPRSSPLQSSLNHHKRAPLPPHLKNQPQLANPRASQAVLVHVVAAASVATNTRRTGMSTALARSQPTHRAVASRTMWEETRLGWEPPVPTAYT